MSRRAEAEKRASRERERGKKAGGEGSKERGQCKTVKLLSVVWNGTNQCMLLVKSDKSTDFRMCSWVVVE